jgi:hypothetical protein
MWIGDHHHEIGSAQTTDDLERKDTRADRMVAGCGPFPG